jgi:hypothetical protein
VDPPLGIPKLPLGSERRFVGVKPGHDIVAEAVLRDPVRKGDKELALLANGDRAVALRQQRLHERVEVWARDTIAQTTTDRGRLDMCFEHGDLLVRRRD